MSASFFEFGFSHVFIAGKDVTHFTLSAVLVYFQMDYGLLLDFKLARVVIGNVSKKGENIRSIITWNFFTIRFFNTTLYISLLDLFLNVSRRFIGILK